MGDLDWADQPSGLRGYSKGDLMCDILDCSSRNANVMLRGLTASNLDVIKRALEIELGDRKRKGHVKVFERHIKRLEGVSK